MDGLFFQREIRTRTTTENRNEKSVRVERATRTDERDTKQQRKRRKKPEKRNDWWMGINAVGKKKKRTRKTNEWRDGERDWENENTTEKDENKRWTKRTKKSKEEKRPNAGWIVGWWSGVEGENGKEETRSNDETKRWVGGWMWMVEWKKGFS